MMSRLRAGRRRLTTVSWLVLAALPGSCHSPAQPECSYVVSPAVATVPAAGGVVDLTISTGTSCEWRAGTDVPWAALTGASAGAGPTALRVFVEPNPDFADRRAVVTVASQTVVLTEQGLAPCAYALAPTTLVFPSSGGAGVIDVSAQDYCGWAASTSAPWLTVAGGREGRGSGTITFVVATNDTPVERVATVNVGSRSASVTQAGVTACRATLTPAGAAFGPSGGSGAITVSVLAPCDWAPAADQPWVRVSSITPSALRGNATVRYEVEPNDTNPARDARLTIGDQIFQLRQGGLGECSYAVSPIELVLHWHDQSGQTQVSTQPGCPWSAFADDAWLGLAGGLVGSGSGVLAFAVPPLATEATRRSAIKVRWPTPTAGQNVWVTQEGCRYGIAPSTLTVTATGGRSRIDVLTQPMSASCAIGCSWTAVSRDSWIRVVSGSPGAGDNPFTIEVDANTTGLVRTGVVTVNDRTLTLTQAR